jgi:hypothetical protein
VFDCILVNGDSYSAKNSQHQVYSDYLIDLGVLVYNVAVPGTNNQRIVRSTIEKVLELTNLGKRPLVLIGWSFIRRLEVWYYGNKKNVLTRIPDCVLGNEHKNPKFVTLDWLITENEATLEQKCLVNEDLFVHAQLTNFYTSLFMLANTLESLGVEYRFFSAAKNSEIPVSSFPYIESLQQVQWCVNNKHFFQLHNFCVLDWAKENDPDANPITGHLSTAGHKKFAKFLEGIIYV